MKNDLSIGSIFHPLKRFFRHFHTTLFIVFVVAGLSYSVILITQAVSSAANGDGGVPTTQSETFDSGTMQQLKSFYSSDEAPTEITLPEGRINPFSE